MPDIDFDLDQSLVLAAEDCPPDQFEKIHLFSPYEERLIKALCAHGPVLLRGGRGSGKSALMIEATRRLAKDNPDVFAVYLSLRYLPLLRSTGLEYENYLCKLLSSAIVDQLRLLQLEAVYARAQDMSELPVMLNRLAADIRKRIVILFDDVAHIGREASLEEFFGVFRTISSSSVSCKATIYPGVTRFGVRFDVYNDATVFDLARDERAAGFKEFFTGVLRHRFPELYEKLKTARAIDPADVAAFFGRTTVGNMRGFVFSCNKLAQLSRFGFPELDAVMKELSADYYWPLLEELEPKMGAYQPLIAIARDLAEALFKQAADTKRVPTVIVHRDIVQRLGKLFEILEYVGLIAKREGSRAMRSGGRGPRYVLNLASLLEFISPSRLTREVFNEWLSSAVEQPTDIQPNTSVGAITQPEPSESQDLAVLGLPISKLAQSKAYPYGLTDARLHELESAGLTTIGELAAASDEALLAVPSVGPKWLERIRSTTGQAIWM